MPNLGWGKMEHAIFELVKSKRAVRKFQNEQLSPELISQILNAGRLAGSAKNMQPWHLIAVQDREVAKKLSGCGAFAAHLAGAPLVVVLVTSDPFLRLTVPFDLGRAAQNMMLTAWGSGVGSEMATIYQPDQARAILGVPDAYTIPWCISFGYPAEEQSRPARRSGRRQADEVFHFEKW